MNATYPATAKSSSKLTPRKVFTNSFANDIDNFDGVHSSQIKSNQKTTVSFRSVYTCCTLFVVVFFCLWRQLLKERKKVEVFCNFFFFFVIPIIVTISLSYRPYFMNFPYSGFNGNPKPKIDAKSCCSLRIRLKFLNLSLSKKFFFNTHNF